MCIRDRNNIGIIYAKKGNMLKAIEFFEKALQRSNYPKFIDVYIANLNNCTKAYYEIGNKRKALEYHNMALKKAREFHMPYEEARALYNFATY